jgi:hypothetical protein
MILISCHSYLHFVALSGGTSVHSSSHGGKYIPELEAVVAIRDLTQQIFYAIPLAFLTIYWKAYYRLIKNLSVLNMYADMVNPLY